MFFILIFFLFINQAFALLKFEDGSHPELIASGRALSMGNAYIAKVDDQYSPFYNPAGLGTVRATSFHLFNFLADVSDDYTEVAGSGAGASGVSKNVSKSFKLDGSRQLLVDNKGKVIASRAQTYPNMTFRYLSFGYLAAMKSKSTIEDRAGAKFEYADRVDNGPVASLAASLFGGIFKFGVSGIFLSRSEIIGESASDQTINLTSDQYNRGNMWLVNGGTKLTLPVAFLPTFAATMRNMMGSSFMADGGAGTPEKIKQTYDLGFAITPLMGKRSRFHMEVNVKDAAKKYGEKDSNRICYGAEIDLYRHFFLRGGSGGGYGSGGLGLKTDNFEIDFGTYAMKGTKSNGDGYMDRRYFFSASFGF